jgi:hypothetical protein
MKILQCSKKQYLNVQELKEILEATLWGTSLEDFNRLEVAGSSLKEIVDNLAKICDRTPRINNYISEADNFIKKKDLTISQTMARAVTHIV